MPSKKLIDSEMEGIQIVKALAKAYEQIAVMRMQKARGSVLKARDFLDSINQVFIDVKESYKHQIQQLLEKNSKLKKDSLYLNTTKKNGQQALILLSANTGLYGDIVLKVFKLFEDSLKSNPNSKPIIIGKLGKSYFETSSLKKDFQYFDLPDVDPTYEQLNQIIQFILQFEKVDVFYGRFNNVMTQTAISTDVSGQSALEQPTQVSPQQLENSTHFRFEPQLESILGFFENQIFSSFFKQTIAEAQLSRFGSRIKAMESALSNIGKKEGLLKNKQNRLKVMLNDKKQLQLFAGLSLWGGK